MLGNSDTPFMQDQTMTTIEFPPQPEQLQLLDASRVPVRLRLDERTRRLGLSEVARARAIIDAQLRRAATDETPEMLPARRLAA